jgi:hypothetical protein
MKSHFAAIGVGLAISVVIIAALMALAPVIARKMADGEGVVSIDMGDARGSYALKDDKREATARWNGDFELTADATGFVARDGDFSIDMTAGGERRRAKWSDEAVEFAAGDNDFSSGEEAVAAASALLQEFARLTGMNAERRMVSIAGSGGVAATLDELDAATSDSAALAFIEAIVGLEGVESADIDRMLTRARKFDNDYDRRRALAILYPTPQASAAARAEIIAAAGGIGAPHEMRLFIEEAATDAAAARALIPLVEKIGDDRDARRAIEHLLAAGATGAEDIPAIASVIAEFSDARQARLAIEATFEAAADKAAARDALRAVASKLGDDEERDQAEEALQ